jgi:hypothetical protein
VRVAGELHERRGAARSFCARQWSATAPRGQCIGARGVPSALKAGATKARPASGLFLCLDALATNAVSRRLSAGACGPPYCLVSALRKHDPAASHCAPVPASCSSPLAPAPCTPGHPSASPALSCRPRCSVWQFCALTLTSRVHRPTSHDDLDVARVRHDALGQGAGSGESNTWPGARERRRWRPEAGRDEQAARRSARPRRQHGAPWPAEVRLC